MSLSPLVTFIPPVDLAEPVDAIRRWLEDNIGFFFDAVNFVVGWLVSTIVGALTAPPTVVTILIASALAWWVRSWKFGLFSLLALSLIEAMGFWKETMDTLGLVLVAAIFAVGFGIPIGIIAARRKRFSLLLRPALDFAQTMPSFIYLLVAVIFFAIGPVPGVVASVIFAMPPAVRVTELGIRQVDREVVEAAEAFGATPRQVLRQVQVPLAMPTIMAGVNQVIMLALSMVVIAGLGGAGGLGALVVRAVTRLQIGLGFESGLAVVILAVFLDRVTSSFQERSAVPVSAT